MDCKFHLAYCFYLKRHQRDWTVLKTFLASHQVKIYQLRQMPEEERILKTNHPR